jgi:hypothetical protein
VLTSAGLQPGSNPGFGPASDETGGVTELDGTLEAAGLAEPVGSEGTRLIVVRGNSGSGKSSVARALRQAHGRGLAWVPQDVVRRTIVWERDRPGGVNIGLIDQIARYCLDQGYHVVLDGILYADRYEPMLAGLRRDHLGSSWFYYLDVSLDETLRRHATRPQAGEFGPEDMRDWYRPRDLLSSVRERVIPEASTLAQTVSRILAETRLTDGADPGTGTPGAGRCAV